MLGALVGGIASLFTAKSQRKISEEASRKAGNWEDYQVSDQAKQMLGEAQARRGASMPGMGIAQAQQLGTQANLLGAASRQGTSGANFMALAAALGGQSTQAGLGMAQQQAQFNEGQQAQVNQARGVMMGEEQKRFQNQLNRFQYYDQISREAQQARLQNIQSGISGIASGVGDIFMTAAGGGLLGKGLEKAFGGGGGALTQNNFGNMMSQYMQSNPNALGVQARTPNYLGLATQGVPSFGYQPSSTLFGGSRYQPSPTLSLSPRRP
jgi:hypothetical protein